VGKKNEKFQQQCEAKPQILTTMGYFTLNNVDQPNDVLILENIE